MPLLEVNNLTHIYSLNTPFERTALSDVSFFIDSGEYLGIIGATGSGKSTLLQHLNGLLKPTSGSIKYNGRDIHETKQFTREVRFKVGLVYQYPEYQLFEATVFEDIAFGPKNMGLSDEEVKQRVRESAEFVKLREPLLEKSPFELSGGEKRRAAIAGVIAMRPEILILDEPTAGLDPRGQREIIQNIASYRQAQGATIILVTHNMNEIARSAQRLICLCKGTLSLEGSPAEVFGATEKLAQLGLSAPKAAQLAENLRALGVPVNNDVYTIKRLRKELLELRERGFAINA